MILPRLPMLSTSLWLASSRREVPAPQHRQVAGWIVLIAGIMVFLAGFAVMRGALWAKIVGNTLASLSALASFFFIPFYPLWALMVITLDIFVIWVLAAHGKALVEG